MKKQVGKNRGGQVLNNKNGKVTPIDINQCISGNGNTQNIFFQQQVRYELKHCEFVQVKTGLAHIKFKDFKNNTAEDVKPQNNNTTEHGENNNIKEIQCTVTFSNLLQLINLSNDVDRVLGGKIARNYKAIVKLLEDYNCSAYFSQWVQQFIERNDGEHYALMAQSLVDSCRLNKDDNPNKAVKRTIKSVINNGGKKKLCVFLSAITSINGKNTIEYQAARYINCALKKCGIGVFWWEDEELNDKKWFVSSKIATGLALSSIFVSLAYDSVTVQKGGKVDFTCFDEKSSPCFKYENDTFKSFVTNATTSDEFFKGFHTGKNKCPQTRILKVFSYGEPNGHAGNNSFFNNINQCVIATPIQSVNDEEKIKLIFKSVISEIFEILKKDKSGQIRPLCPNVYKRYLQKQSKEDLDKYIDTLWEQAYREATKNIKSKRYSGANYSNLEGKYSNLYNSFGAANYKNVDYCDDFLGNEWEKKNDKYSYMVEGSKENIAAVPSDFEFKYAIVDETGKNAKNHFLVFPERYNDDKGNCKWRMKLVVRDWNLRATVDGKYRKYLLSDAKEFKSDDEFLKCFPLSQYSKIKFYKDKTDFSTEYNEREDLTERASEYATCKTYSDNQDETRDGRTNVASGDNNGRNNHCAFILNEDVLDEINPKYHLKGSLKLVSDSLKSDSLKTVKPFYISVIFYPKPVVYNKKTAKLPLRRKTETDTRCPYCGRIIGEVGSYESKSEISSDFLGRDKDVFCYSIEDENKDKDYCDGNTFSFNGVNYCTCQHNFIGDIYALNDLGNVFRSKGIAREGVSKDGLVYGEFLDGNEKECDAFYAYMEHFSKKTSSPLKKETYSKYRLVYDNCYKNGAVVTMVGLSQSGKSTFISRMLSVHSDGNYEGHISCSYLNNAMKPYVKSVKSVAVKTVEMVKSDKSDHAINKGINGVRLLEDYKTSKYSEFLSSTQNEQKEPVLPHTPFTIELEMNQNSRDDEKSFLSFFDLSGGLFEIDGEKTGTLGNLHKDYTMLHHSDSIILLLSIDNPYGNASMIQAITRRIPKGTIVAVVFCKADELFVDTHYKWEHITRSAPVARDNKFNGSKRQAYIDECSKEIEKELSDGSDDNIKAMMAPLKRSLKGYPYKFFAISALGRGDSIVKGVNEKKYTLYETTPLNIENVLLWIMFEKGIIE